MSWAARDPGSTPRPSPRTPPVAERVLERIRAEGPLSSRDFERETGPTKDWFGMPENAVRAVLEAYTVTGVIGLARRDGNSGTTTSSNGCSRQSARARGAGARTAPA
jgi:Protein of unknown function (DUF1006).